METRIKSVSRPVGRDAPCLANGKRMQFCLNRFSITLTYQCQGPRTAVGGQSQRRRFCLDASRRRRPIAYFLTHAFLASSHFMSLAFSQSALVFGASAANAGAATASRRPVMMAVRTILA